MTFFPIGYRTRQKYKSTHSTAAVPAHATRSIMSKTRLVQKRYNAMSGDMCTSLPAKLCHQIYGIMIAIREIDAAIDRSFTWPALEMLYAFYWQATLTFDR